MQASSATPESHLQSAANFFAQKRLREAEADCRAALALDPVSRAGLSLLGSVLHGQERYQDAEEIFLKLTQLEPAEPFYWMNIGTARRCLGRVDEALFAFARAAALGAATSDFYYNVALAHIDRSDYESARSLLAKALAIAPDDAEIRYRYAWCCYECLQTDEALDALAGWDAHESANRAVTADVGHLLMKLGDADRAEPAVRQAVMNDAADVRSRLTLVQVLERTNRLSEAASLLDELARDPRAIELGSDLELTQAQLAQRNSQSELACGLYRKVLDQCTELHSKHFVQYPFAKALDSAGRYDDAFEMAVEAHRSQAEFLRLSAPLMVLRGAPTFQIANYGCDPLDVSRWEHSSAPSAAQSPVFIVAFPRSGTTLLELVLDAHPLLKSMDEQPFLQNALDDVLAEGIHYPTDMARLTNAQLDKIRVRYWTRVARKVSLDAGQRLVDKNPLNLLRVPLIKRLFPNAHILLAVRHPCDVLLSCFMQHFRAPDFALLCQDLPTLARGYCKAFDFWYAEHALLAPNSRELRYETFVSDFDAQVRSTIAFLELPWTDAVLAPGERAMEKRFISTPSYSQVVQPINQKAVGRWRNYERHFAPVLPIVRPYLDRWSYDG